MKKEIKQLRVEIDGLIQLCKGLKPYSNLELGRILRSLNSDEILEAIKSLKLSKAWLGKVLGELGEETPYKNEGNRKTKEDIESTADTAEKVYGAVSLNDTKSSKLKAVDTFTLNGRIMNDYTNLNHIEKVDWLREEIKQLANIVLEINEGKLNQRTYSEYEEKLQWNAYSYLQEARFWLGFELGRIREENK